MNEITPKLFKYYPFTALSLACLKRRVIFFARPARFNDPFDCRIRLRPRALSVEEVRKLLDLYGDRSKNLEAVREVCRSNPQAAEQLLGTWGPMLSNLCDEILRETFSGRGVCCFAEKKDHLLLWAHYADGHRGFCLEFDTSFEPFTRAERVVYQPSYPSGIILSTYKVAGPLKTG